jgi:DNA-directed RNA polymerase specialized sigma24 family protein
MLKEQFNPTPAVIAYERNLMQRAKTDPGAFGELYKIYRKPVLGFLYTRTDFQSALDLTANTFLTIFEKIDEIPQLEEGKRPLAYFFNVARNKVMQHNRDLKRHKTTSLSTPVNWENLQDRMNVKIDDIPIYSKQDIDPQVSYPNRELLANMISTIQNLPPDQKNAAICMLTNGQLDQALFKELDIDGDALRLSWRYALIKLREARDDIL